MPATNTAAIVSNLRIEGTALAHAVFLLDGVPHSARMEGESPDGYAVVIVRNDRTGDRVDFISPEVEQAVSLAREMRIDYNAAISGNPTNAQRAPIVLPTVSDAG